MNNSKEFLEEQEEMCRTPNTAYEFAKANKNADIKKYQEAACKHPGYAYCIVKK